MMIEVDTIAALASAPGVGALAVVRISGPDAFGVLQRVTRTDAIPEARVATLLTVIHPATGTRADQVLATAFPCPASYTGEDVVELSGHGGTLAPALVLDAVLSAGARQAEPGEFTRRAWLNGKLDLLQAEAVHDLIEGRSLAAHRTALHQLDRGLSARVDHLRNGLIGLEALLVHHIDFPEEDDAPTPLAEIAVRAGALVAELDALAGTAAEGVLLRRGALVVLAGVPNAGKSSLLNALAGEERALVTEIAGTTRDAIEVEVSLGGFPFRLVDTAGLRETDQLIEQMGIEVAERYLGAADLVIWCTDTTGPELDSAAVVAALSTRAGAPIVRVRTKADLEDASTALGSTESSRWLSGEARGTGVAADIRVSVISGRGLAELRTLLPSLVFRGLVSTSDTVPVLTRERQSRAVRTAANEVREFSSALTDGVPAEVASAHLKSATTALEELLGIVTEDDVLDAVFRSFCVGK